MENEPSVYLLIIIGTAAIALFAMITVVVLIIYQRKIFLKDMMITMYKDECREEIQQLKQEIEKLKAKSEQ